jgi:hypothetical protein
VTRYSRHLGILFSAVFSLATVAARAQQPTPGPTQALRKVQVGGVDLPYEPIINLGAGLTAVDNPGSKRLDFSATSTLSGLTAGRIPVATSPTAIANSGFTASGNVLDLASSGALQLGSIYSTEIDVGDDATAPTVILGGYDSIISLGDAFFDGGTDVGGTITRNTLALFAHDATAGSPLQPSPQVQFEAHYWDGTAGQPLTWLNSALADSTAPTSSFQFMFNNTPKLYLRSSAALELNDGSTASVSAAGFGGLRYNNTSKLFEVSADGGAWSPLATGTSGVSGTLTSGRLPVATGAHALGDSSFTASGNTLSVASGSVSINAASGGQVNLQGNGTTFWSVGGTGTFFPATDNTLQIGGTSNRVSAFVGSVLQSAASAGAADTAGHSLTLNTQTGGAASATGGGAGGTLSLNANAGGAGTGTLLGGAGGPINVTAGAGGAGTASVTARGGGSIAITAGSAGADGGAGGSTGGNIALTTGNGTGVFASGNVFINIPTPPGAGSYGRMYLQAGGTSRLGFVPDTATIYPLTTNTGGLGGAGNIFGSVFVTTTRTNTVSSLSSTQLSFGINGTTYWGIATSGTLFPTNDSVTNLGGAVNRMSAVYARQIGSGMTVAAAADTSGSTMNVNSQQGGNASATGGGSGGQLNVIANNGGNGTGSLNPGTGGAVVVQTGAPGTGGSGNASSGSMTFNIPAPVGSGSYGTYTWQFNGTSTFRMNNLNTAAFQVAANGSLGVISQSSANTTSLTVQGNVADGASSVNIALDGVTSLTSGKLVSIRNAGTEQLYFDASANPTFTNTATARTIGFITQATDVIGQDLTIAAQPGGVRSASANHGGTLNLLAGDGSNGAGGPAGAGGDVRIQSGAAPGDESSSVAGGSIYVNLGTASSGHVGKVRFQNNGTDKVTIDEVGQIAIASGGSIKFGDGTVQTTASTGGGSTGNWTFSGNNADLTAAGAMGIGNIGPTATSVVFGPTTVNFQPATTLGQTSAGATNTTGLTIKPNVTDGASSVNLVIDSATSITSGKVVSIRNAGTEMASAIVSGGGGLYLQGDTSTPFMRLSSGVGTELGYGANKLTIDSAQITASAKMVLVGFDNTGRVSGKYRHVTTTPVTLTTDDYVVGVDRTTATTLNLPAASTCTPGMTLLVNNMVGTAPTISITANGTDTINGATTQTITRGYGGYVLWTDGVSQWFISGSN